MSTVLVTGGAGFIGSHLAERLFRLGHDVRVLDDLSTGRLENLAGFESGVELIVGDVRDESVLSSAVDGVDVVFHEAALASVPRSVTDPIASNDVNVTGTLRLLVAARDAGVRRLINASSSSVYGNAPELPKREDMASSPESPYAVSKLAAESYCRAFASLYDFECVSLRYFNVFGPRQDPNSQYAAVVPLFVSALLCGEAPVIYGDGEQSRDFTYVGDVVEANISAMESDGVSGEVFNIACGRTTTVNTLLSTLQDILGTSIEPRHEGERPGDVRHSYADVSKARSALGVNSFVPLRDALEITAESFRDGKI
jgi:UDP-glucose 4-epimerase